MMEHGIEVIPPNLANFFLQNFVNRLTNRKLFLDRGDKFPGLLVSFVYNWITKQIIKIDNICEQFAYYIPSDDVFEEAKNGREVINMAAQFGEGWLLPAEIVTFAKAGINNVISLQPFGCIANHIVSKGIEKKIKTLYPQMNLLSLDFDSGVSDVNIANRLLLFVDNIQLSTGSKKRKPSIMEQQRKAWSEEVML